jgi:aspartate kinase
MRTHTGVAEKMFAALAAEGVNMKMITTADIKISVLVGRDDGKRALMAVHEAFGLAQARPGAGQPRPDGAPLVPQKKANGRALAALTQQLARMEDIVVSDVLLSTDQARLTVNGMPDRPGACLAVFQAVAAGGIVVDMIVQNTSGGRVELSFSVPRADLERGLELTRRVATGLDAAARVAADADVATLYVLGVGMRSHTGVARKMFGALAARGINIGLINTSEVRVSVVVERNRGEEALACLKEAFGLS